MQKPPDQAAFFCQTPASTPQATRVQQIEHTAGAADQAALTQMAKHTRQRLGRNPQLGGNQALALLQRHGQGPLLAGLGMAQQPFGAACLGILGQPAHGQFGLAPMRRGHVLQDSPRRHRHGSQRLAKTRQRNTPQHHLGFGHRVHDAGQAQHGGRGLQPERPLDLAELMRQDVTFHHTQRHAAGLHIHHRGGRAATFEQHGARRRLAAFGTGVHEFGWQHGSHCAAPPPRRP